MASHRVQDVIVIFIIFLLPFLLVGSVSAQDIVFLNVNCSNSNSFGPNSNYQYSLFNLLSNLTSEASVKGFYEGSIGQSPNQVYAFYLCRGDTNQQLCHSCVQNATETIVQECPYQIGAMIWYDICWIRYSNESFFGKLDGSVLWYLWNIQDITNVSVTSFRQVVNNTLNLIAARATNGDQLGRKFATQEANVSSSLILYALGQCTPDLSISDCRLCLTACIDVLLNNTYGKQGGRMFYGTNCYVRYEIYPFFDQTVVAAPAPAPTTSTSGEKKKKKKKISKTAITAIAAIASLLLIGSCIFFIPRRRAKRSYNTINAQTKSVDIKLQTADSLQYDWRTIRVATNNFSDSNKIGKGGFGVVYKGTLDSGQEIAVKRLFTSSERVVEEFKNEVVLVAKLQHKNLVRLLGYCLAREEKLLVFEFVPNKSLDYFLFNPDKRGQLDWRTRYKIIAGIARGLLYLHEDSRLRIIHRDLKASNILLDADMDSKISDFGLARLVGGDQSLNETERVAGTLGYMAPEYLSHGQFSVKSDVYSFGVLILEIISGKKVRNVQQSDVAEDLLTNAWKHWRDGKALEFMDQTLEISHCSVDEIMGCIQLGLLCVQQDVGKRPTMASVVHMLKIDSINQLPVPQQPSFFHSNNPESSSSLIEHPTGKSIGSLSTEITVIDAR
ncbi:Cysteine-rich receptor-like protein kinase, variant 2 [Ancistrocladus abbreviatus]